MKKYNKIINLKSTEKVYFDIPKEVIEDNTHIYALASIKDFKIIDNSNLISAYCKAKCYIKDEKIICEVTGSIKENGSLEVNIDILLLKDGEFDNKTFMPVPINKLKTLNK